MAMSVFEIVFCPYSEPPSNNGDEWHRKFSDWLDSRSLIGYCSLNQPIK